MSYSETTGIINPKYVVCITVLITRDDGKHQFSIDMLNGKSYDYVFEHDDLERAKKCRLATYNNLKFGL